MFSSAPRPPPPRPPPRHNFVVSAITFEGFKRSSTYIAHPNISDEFDNRHYRPIQNGGRFVKKRRKVSYRSEMVRNVIFGYLKWRSVLNILDEFDN